LVWFIPEKIKEAHIDYPLNIDHIYLDDSSVEVSTFKKIAANIQSIRIDISSPYWGQPDNLYREYKLEGYQKQWIPLSPLQSVLEFSNLPSGSYKLHIRKQLGLSNEFKLISLPFEIEKKYYETWWFWLLMAICSLLIIITIARLYALNIRRKNILLETNVRLRTLELHKANEELTQSVKVKDKLISIISHDIVTPLRFITMVARKGASEQASLDTKHHKVILEEIKNTTEKLHENAQNILNWIKHQNKRININISNVAIGALAEDITEQFMDIAYNKGTRIINAISHDDIIQTDANLVSIILHNIISNAAKFTENGYIRISSEANRFYTIKIEDNGKGMPENQVDHINQILEKKTIIENATGINKEGFGLGYVIIAELIAMLKGKITISSELNKGTSVIIELPVSN
jgi:signal transduction histidine kinase